MKVKKPRYITCNSTIEILSSILQWALRESLPQPSMENLAPASLSPPSGPSEAEEEEEEYLPEDPLHAPPVITVDDDGDQVCDSTTSAFPARSAKGRAFRRRVQAPDSASRQEAAEVARTRKSQRQQRKATDSETDGDACRSASEVSESGDGFKTDLLTRSLKKVTDKQRERMKLSSQQKEQGQTRFKDLYNKMVCFVVQFTFCHFLAEHNCDKCALKFWDYKVTLYFIFKSDPCAFIV